MTMVEGVDQPLGVALAVFAMFFATSYLTQIAYARNKPWKMVPGWLPILGHFHQLFRGGRPGMIQTIEKWADKYGTDTGCFEFEVFGRKQLVVCREDTAMEILTQRPFKVTRTKVIQEAVNSVGATGVFSAEGEQWRQEKKLVSATLNKNNMFDYVPVLKETALALIQKWEDQVKESPEGLVCIKQDLGHAPADAVGKVFVGKDFDFLHHPESDVATLVTQGFKAIERRAFAPFYFWKIPFIGQDLDGFGKYLRSGMAILSEIIKDFEEERNSKSKKGHGDTGSKTFLSKLYDVMEKENSKLDHERIVGNIVTAFAAGIDTTSLAMVTTLYILACDKELQQDLYDHVKDFDLEAATLQDYYTKAPLLKSFLHEVHRYHATPILAMEPTTDIPFCGTTLPKGTEVLVFYRHIMLQKDAPAKGVPLGPDNVPPQEFSHRRYLVPIDEDSDTAAADKDGATKWQCVDPITKGAAFLPFGHGVRSCPGRAYSEILSYAMVIKMLQTFDFELAPNHPPVAIVADTIMAPDKDIQLKLTLR